MQRGHALTEALTIFIALHSRAA